MPIYEKLEKKKSMLYDKLRITNSGITWPWNIGNAIRQYSSFYETTSLGICPESSINRGFPGINLRNVKLTSIKGGMHYRAVIGYKKPGWWIFKWWQIKVIDLVDCKSDDELKNGRWETYIPLYHFSSYNILHK